MVDVSGAGNSPKAVTGAFGEHKADSKGGKALPIEVPKSTLYAKRKIDFEGDTKVPDPNVAKTASQVYKRAYKW